MGEQSKLAFERLPIPAVFHPFVCGPNKINITRWTEETGAKISVPPQKDEIVVSGEKEGVLKCKAMMMGIYEDKKRICQTGWERSRRLRRRTRRRRRWRGRRRRIRGRTRR